MDTGLEFATFDILTDPEIRQGLKDFSNWPTYPQLYANATLVGGCDIIEELAAGGDLKQTILDELNNKTQGSNTSVPTTASIPSKVDPENISHMNTFA